MSWFGWLTKGQLEVSLLDRFTMLAELLALVLVAVLLTEILHHAINVGVADRLERLWRWLKARWGRP